MGWGWGLKVLYFGCDNVAIIKVDNVHRLVTPQDAQLLRATVAVHWMLQAVIMFAFEARVRCLGSVLLTLASGWLLLVAAACVC